MRHMRSNQNTVTWFQQKFLAFEGQQPFSAFRLDPVI